MYFHFLINKKLNYSTQTEFRWCWIERKSVIKIQMSFEITRVGIDLSVCVCVNIPDKNVHYSYNNKNNYYFPRTLEKNSQYLPTHELINRPEETSFLLHGMETLHRLSGRLESLGIIGTQLKAPL